LTWQPLHKAIQKTDWYSDDHVEVEVELDPNDTAPTAPLRVTSGPAIPAIPDVPDESEETLLSDITTHALSQAQIAAARARDELNAIMQGDRAVIERALRRAEMEAFVRESAVAIARAVDKLAPREALDGDTLHAAHTLVAFLDRER